MSVNLRGKCTPDSGLTTETTVCCALRVKAEIARAGSSYLDMSRYSSNLLEPGRRSVRIRIPLRYLAQTGPMLVADLLARASSLLAS